MPPPGNDGTRLEQIGVITPVQGPVEAVLVAVHPIGRRSDERAAVVIVQRDAAHAQDLGAGAEIGAADNDLVQRPVPPRVGAVPSASVGLDQEGDPAAVGQRRLEVLIRHRLDGPAGGHRQQVSREDDRPQHAVLPGKNSP